MEDIKNPGSPPPEARLHFLDYWRVIRIRKAIIITVFLITAIIATAVTFILPESYSSTARIKVENEGGIIQGMETPSAVNYGYDPYFIQTTFEIIQSEMVLSNVISHMDLNNAWGKKYNNGEPLKTTETLEFLKNQISLAPVRNTKLIAITVYSYDKNEAANLANGIAEAYRDYRLNNSQQTLAAGLDALTQNYLEESNRIDALQHNVENLRREYGIIDGDVMTPQPTMSQDALRKYNDEKLEDERGYKELLTQLQSLQTIEATNKPELRDVIPTMFPESTLSSLLDQLHEAQREQSRLLVDYSSTNFQVARVDALITRLDQQADERVDGFMAGLNAQVNAKKASLDLLTEKVEEAKTNDFADANRNQPYYDEKYKLTQLMEVHRLLYSKIKAQTIDASIPRTSMVEITDVAVPGKAPVKPNKPLNIILGLVFGLIMGIGLAFFI
jgi:succinoglycan biosynthesis transport protein ExoP